jgi:hypothetical protein
MSRKSIFDLMKNVDTNGNSTTTKPETGSSRISELANKIGLSRDQTSSMDAPKTIEVDPNGTQSQELDLRDILQSTSESAWNSFIQGVNQTQIMNSFGKLDSYQKILDDNALYERSLKTKLGTGEVNQEEYNKALDYINTSNNEAKAKIESYSQSIEGDQSDAQDNYVSKLYKLKEAQVQAKGGDARLWESIKYTVPSTLGSSASLMGQQLAVTFGADLIKSTADKLIAGSIGGPVGEGLAIASTIATIGGTLFNARNEETWAEKGGALQQNQDKLLQQWLEQNPGLEPTEDDLRTIRMNARKGIDDMGKEQMALMFIDAAEAMLMPGSKVLGAFKFGKSAERAVGAITDYNKVTRAVKIAGKTYANYVSEKFEEGYQYATQKRQEDLALGLSEYKNKGLISNILSDSFDTLSSISYGPSGTLSPGGKYSQDKEFQFSEQSGGLLSILPGSIAASTQLFKDIALYRNTAKELSESGAINVDEKIFKLKAQILKKHFDNDTMSHLIEGVRNLKDAKNEKGLNILTESQVNEEISNIRDAYDKYIEVGKHIDNISKDKIIIRSEKQAKMINDAKIALFISSLRSVESKKRTPVIESINNISNLIDHQESLVKAIKEAKNDNNLNVVFDLTDKLTIAEDRLKRLNEFKANLISNGLVTEDKLPNIGSVEESNANLEFTKNHIDDEMSSKEYSELLKIRDEDSLKEWHKSVTKKQKEKEDIIKERRKEDAKLNNTEEQSIENTEPTETSDNLDLTSGESIPVTNVDTTKTELSSDISDEEYEAFLDGFVSPDRLKSISDKVKNKSKLSDREKEIFTDKTTEVNSLLVKELELEKRETETADKNKYNKVYNKGGKNIDPEVEYLINTLNFSSEDVLKDITIHVKKLDTPFESDKFSASYEITVNYNGKLIGYIVNPQAWDKANLVQREGKDQVTVSQLLLEKESNRKFFRYVTQLETIKDKSYSALELVNQGLISFTTTGGTMVPIIDPKQRPSVESVSDSLIKDGDDIVIIDRKDLRPVGIRKFTDELLPGVTDFDKYSDRYVVAIKDNMDRVKLIPCQPKYIGLEQVEKITSDIVKQSEIAYKKNFTELTEKDINDDFNLNINDKFFFAINEEAYSASSPDGVRYAALNVSVMGGLTLEIFNTAGWIKVRVLPETVRNIRNSNDLVLTLNNAIKSNDKLSAKQKMFEITPTSFRKSVSLDSAKDAANDLVIGFDVNKTPIGNHMLINFNDDALNKASQISLVEAKPTTTDTKTDIERRRQEELKYPTEQLNYWIEQENYSGQENQIAIYKKQIADINKKYTLELKSLTDSNVYKKDEIQQNRQKEINDIFNKIGDGDEFRDKRKPLIDAINAKYDAELAALEQPKVQEVIKPNVDIKNTVVSQPKLEDLLAQQKKVEDDIATLEGLDDYDGADFLIESKLNPIKAQIAALNPLMPNNQALKISEVIKDGDINIKEAYNYIESILPSFINKDDLNTILSNLKVKGIPYGAFLDSTIYLSPEAPKGTEYHEAFHAVFRTLLTDVEINKYLSQAKKEKDSISSKQIDEFRNTYGLNNKSDAYIEQLIYEEYMADKFEDWKKSKNNKKHSFFVGLFVKLLDWINFNFKNKETLSALFWKIDRGDFRQSDLVQNRFFNDNTSVYSLLPSGSDQFGTPTYLNSKRSESLIATITADFAQRKVSNMKSDIKMTDGDIIRDVINSKYTESTLGYNKDILISLTKDKKESLKKELMAEMFALSNEDSVKLIISEVQKRSIIFDFKALGEEQSNDDKVNDIGDRFDLNASNIGGFGSLSKAIRQLIGFTIIQEKDEYGRLISRAIDASRVYNSLERLLANTPKSEMIKKIQAYSKYNKEVAFFYNKLKSLINYNEETGTFDENNIYYSFTRAFNKSKVFYIFGMIDPRKGLYNFFNANQRDVAKQQVSDWGNTFDNPKYGFNVKSKAEKKYILNNISKLNGKFLSPTKEVSSPLSEVELNQAVSDIKLSLLDIGIDLSEGFISYSILQNRHLTEDQKMFVNSFNGINPIQISGSSNDVISDLVFNIKQGSGTKALYGGNPFIKTLTEEGEELDDDLLSRLNELAENNAIFDERVGSSSFQNAEGETVYDKIISSFAIRRIQDFKSKNKESLSSLDAFKQWNPGLSDYDAKNLYELFKLNPLLNNINADVIFGSDFNINLIDGLRQQAQNINSETGEVFADMNKSKKEGKTFGSMETRDIILMMYGLYANPKVKSIVSPEGVKSKVNMSNYYFKVLEASKTGYTISLPNGKYFQSGRLTKDANDALYNFFQQELDRISRTYKELDKIKDGDTSIPVIENFHNGKTRGINFFNFKFTPELTKELIEIAKKGETTLTPKLKSRVQSEIDTKFLGRGKELEDHISQLVDLGVIEPLMVNGVVVPNRYKNLLLPVLKDSQNKITGGFVKETSDNGQLVDLDEVGNFFFNHLINTWSINQLVDGDISYSRKDAIDYVKRNKGSNAAAETYGNGVSNGAIFTEPKVYLDKDTNEHIIPEDVLNSPSNLKKYIKEQGLTEVKVADAQMYETLSWRVHKLTQKGKYSDRVKSIYDKIINDDYISDEDLDVLIENDAMLVSDKDIYFDGMHYFKLSSFPLTRQYTSFISTEGTEGAVKSSVNGKWYIANPTRLVEFNMQNEMESKGLHYSMPESASKGASKNVSILGELKSISYMNSSWGMQHEVPSGKTVITDGSQKNGLIDSEQNPRLKPKIDEYQKLLAQRTNNNVFRAMNILKNNLGDGSYTLRYVIDKFNQTLQDSGADASMLDFFAKNKVTGEPIFELNLPLTIGKFEQLFYAHFTTGVLYSKAPGHTFVLKSDFGVTVAVDENDNIVTSNEIKSGYKYSKLRPLAFKKKDKDGNYYSEVMIPKHFREFGIKPGDNLSEDAMKMLGFRIPTQDKHSMITIKVVDYLPEFYGSIIIAPKQLVLLSGADFDVDKLYARRYDHYIDPDGKIKLFGKNGSDPITKWREYLIAETSNNKDFKRLSKEKKDVDPNLVTPLTLKELGLPSTKEEYESYVKNHGEINTSIVNNRLLDLEIQLYSNEHIDKITKTPSSLTELEDLISELNIKEEVGKYSIYSINGMMASKKDNDTGKSNIGPSAVSNMIFNLLAKNDVKIDKPLVFNNTKYDKFKYLNSEGVRVNHLISTILSAMTDNAKERMASKFNLTLDTLPVALYMVASGMPLKSVMKITTSDVIKDYAKRLSIKNAGVKTASEEYLSDNKIVSEMIQELRKKVLDSKSVITQEDEESSLTDSDISSNTPESNYKLFDFFINAKDDAKIFSSINSLMQLNKGFKPSISENNKVNEITKSLGLGLDDAEFKKLKLPFDVRSIFNTNNYVSSNIKAYNQVHNDAANAFFISRSNMFTTIFNVTKNNLKSAKVNSEELMGKIDKNILSYITFNAYKNYVINSNNDKLKGDYLPSTNLNNIIGDDNIVNRVSNLKANKKYKDNMFLYYLEIDKATPKNSLVFNQMSSNTRSKMHPVIMEQILNDFNTLYIGKNTRQDAIDIFNYLLVKDGLQFKNRSISRYIASHMFRTISDSLTGARELMKSDNIDRDIFSTTFGNNKEDFFSEFLDDTFLYREHKFDYMPFIKSIEDNPVFNITGDKLTITPYNDMKFIMDSDTFTIKEVKGNDEVSFPLYLSVGDNIYKLQNTSFNPSNPREVNQVKSLFQLIDKDGMAFGTNARYKKVEQFGIKEISPYTLNSQEKSILELKSLDKIQKRFKKPTRFETSEDDMGYEYDDTLTEEQSLVASVVNNEEIKPNQAYAPKFGKSLDLTTGDIDLSNIDEYGNPIDPIKPVEDKKSTPVLFSSNPLSDFKKSLGLGKTLKIDRRPDLLRKQRVYNNKNGSTYSIIYGKKLTESGDYEYRIEGKAAQPKQVDMFAKPSLSPEIQQIKNDLIEAGINVDDNASSKDIIELYKKYCK